MFSPDSSVLTLSSSRPVDDSSLEACEATSGVDRASFLLPRVDNVRARRAVVALGARLL